eukprot:TRINITY_DN10100_c0_g1_i2.p2 TRINITY_DN10100_c0_g1~~TRINITY_DN10100_c0_g1_i2.p2  ORF type:complete len:111 (-),score=2.02 TRINITY_DN10100_c0_g1_i2:258-590(-)
MLRLLQKRHVQSLVNTCSRYQTKHQQVNEAFGLVASATFLSGIAFHTYDNIAFCDTNQTSQRKQWWKFWTRSTKPETSDMEQLKLQTPDPDSQNQKFHLNVEAIRQLKQV